MEKSDVSYNKLILNTRSWHKDSFGLFDFESKDFSKQQIKIEKTCKKTTNFDRCS